MAVYLDNAATTRPAAQVIAAITDCLTEHYGNPSSLHRLGLDAELCMKEARKAIAGALGTEPERILFTSGATESSNLALRGAAAVYGKRQRHIVTSAVEHASVRSTMDALGAQGFHVTRVLPDADGVFHAQDFVDAVTEDTCLISMMLVENETGRILPVGDVFRRLKKKFPKLITHCDAVQGFMKLPVRVNSLNADLLSISAHKIHGPKGVGALYICKGVRLQPLTTGGKQENAIRPGTEAVPLIVGFGAAVQYMQPTIQERFTAVQAKRDALLQILSKMEGITVNSTAEGSPYIVNFSVDDIRSETMLHFLEEEEIYVSSGSACSKGARSGVLLAYGISDERADSAIRVSFSEETTDEDLNLLTAAIVRGQKSLVHKKR